NAGNSNVAGSNNTIIGAKANVFGDLTNATAIGYKALVGQSNSLILGSINGTNGATADTKVGIGTTTPIEPLTIDTEGNALHGVYGWVQQNGSIVFGSKAGGMGAQPFGGWLGTKTNHPLSFFVNDGGPILTFETSGFVRLNNIDVSGNSSL